jgi:lipopolysaccharide export system permease protein
MTIIDRYVLRTYAKVLVVCLFSLFGLFVVIDGFNNFDEFYTYGKRHALGAPGVMAEYYAPRLLWFFDRTAGIVGMVAAGFVLTLLQRTNELTAIVAAGIPPVRVVKPLLGASICVSLLAVANREAGLPRVRDLLSKNAQDWLGEAARKCTPRYDIRTDILIAGKATYAKEKRIAEPLFRLPPELAAWGRSIAADSAYYQAQTDERPGGYLVRGVKQPATLAALPSAALGGGAVLLSPADTPWLKPDECFVVSMLTFEQLSAGGAWRRYLSSYEIISGLYRQIIDPGADIRLLLHARLVQPLLDLSLVLLAIPLVLNRGGRNIFVVPAIGGGVVAGLRVVVLISHSLGVNYVLPSTTLAAWLPLLIFGPVAYASGRRLWD